MATTHGICTYKYIGINVKEAKKHYKSISDAMKLGAILENDIVVALNKFQHTFKTIEKVMEHCNLPSLRERNDEKLAI